MKVLFNSFFSPNCKKIILDIDIFSCMEGGSPLWAFQVPPLDSIDNYYKLTKPYQGHHCMCRDQDVASDIVHVVAKSVFWGGKNLLAQKHFYHFFFEKLLKIHFFEKWLKKYSFRKNYRPNSGNFHFIFYFFLTLP